LIQKNWQELIKPQKLNVQPGRRPDPRRTIIVEPLERGFGITIGNACAACSCRRCRAAAVSAIQIDGVLHEFSSIPGVREDVTDIVLNLKSLGVRLHSDVPKRVYLKAEGPKVVTGGMIETGHDVEIMDPTR
jgi:DNA-directed RNA polymerase subunit alpha